MTARPIVRLKELRALRETRARVRLGMANHEQIRLEEDRDRALSAARVVEAELPERKQNAVRAVLAEGANPATLARMSLQYQIGQADLVTALRNAAQLKRQAEQQQILTSKARQEWSERAKDVVKLDILIDRDARTARKSDESAA